MYAKSKSVSLILRQSAKATTQLLA